MPIGKRLREERERLGLSQPAFAAVAGTSKQTLFSWETGKTAPDGFQLSALATAGADVLYILTGQRAGGVKPAPTLTADEETMLNYFRDASKEVRRAALGALLGASGQVTARASGSGQNVVGDNAIQIGSVTGKARIKNR
ncbi:helix-turn-helix protein [Acidovorax sp. 94]|nr:helix-turn-helix protein [Acidovorax sp. 94]